MCRFITVHYINPVNGLMIDQLEINQQLIKDFIQYMFTLKYCTFFLGFCKAQLTKPYEVN